MQRKNNVADWLGAMMGICLALLLNVTLGHAAGNAIVTEEFHKTYPLSANGRVALENINGPVHISVWDRNEVKVDAVKSAQSPEELKDAEILVNNSADSISIRTKYPDRDSGYKYSEGRHISAWVEYTLTVPHAARLDEIQLINGPLDVTGAAGEVHAECINGKLTARGLMNVAKLSTVNGELDARFDQLPAGGIELNSVNGKVDLTLPSDVKASIEAETVHGHIGNDFGLRSNDQFVGHGLHGQLGSGGAQIHLTNVNGGIEVHHASDGRTMSPAKDMGERDGDGI